ncbi:MAG: hypothetical protein ACRDJI_00145 [Actinomycetota bacterium]
MACLLLLSGCGGDGDSDAAPSPCPSQVPVDDRDLRLLPRDVPLAEHGVVTEVVVKAGFLGAQAVGDTRIIELYPPLARSVLDAGYDIISSENEGFEAEIFFARGKHITGAYRLREGPCKDQVTIRLLYGAKRYREKKG